MSSENNMDVIELIQDETGDYLILKDKTVLEIIYEYEPNDDGKKVPSYIQDVPAYHQKRILKKSNCFQNKPVRYAVDRNATFHFDSRLYDEFIGKKKELEEIIWEQHEIGDLIDFNIVDGRYCETYEMNLTDRGKNVLELLKTIKSGDSDDQ